MAENVEESKQTLNRIGTEDFRNNFEALIRRRQNLLYLTTNDKPRVADFAKHYCVVHGAQIFNWDCLDGLTVVGGAAKAPDNKDLDIKDSLGILDYIIKQSDALCTTAAKQNQEKEGVKYIIYLLNNFSFYIKDNPDVIARLEKISTRSGMITTIITGINYDMPNCLSHLIPEIAFPHPSKEELSDLVDQFAQVLGPDIQAKNKDIPDFRKYTAKHKEDIIGSVSGLTRSQAASALKTSLVKHKKWDIQTILSEKRDSVHKAGLLEFVNLKFTVDDIGGLSTLVNWLKARKDIFSDSAREYGLPVPKGLLLLGAPGCGKSLTCKAIASLWGMPLLRLDFGKMFHSLVGQSEGNIRQAINLAEHNSPVILWIDEIEKALTGIQSSGKSDGGTTSRVLSTFLTWMQEKTAPVFVVATANAQDQIPTEFMRAGRFDEVFFVKLPSVFERKEITRVLLRRKGWEGNKFNIDDIVANTNGYSGAEIEKAIDNGMLLSFSDKKRDLATKDILKALDNFTPLSRIREDDFIQMEETAKKCLIANTPDPENSISIDNKEKGVVDKADSPKITLD